MLCLVLLEGAAAEHCREFSVAILSILKGKAASLGSAASSYGCSGSAFMSLRGIGSMLSVAAELHDAELATSLMGDVVMRSL